MDDTSEDYEMEEPETSASQDRLSDKMEEPEASESEDRLSELPLSLIFHILSFLPMKEVVPTTILSKRWKNLWNTIPCLNFCDEVDDEVDVERIRNFVNRALIFWRGTKILKFKIDLECNFSLSLAEDVDLWVHFAKENKVEELNIHLEYLQETFDWGDTVEGSKIDIYRAPQCLNSCSSLKALSLVGCNLRIPEPPPWNQLKSLRIDGFCFGERLINRVLLGTPKLEVFDLRLLESHKNLNIESRSLKKLKIEKYLYFDDDYDKPSTTSVLRIRCPNLEMFEISGILYSKCVLKNVSSLTDVILGFYGSHYYDNAGLSGKEIFAETFRQILPTIRDVERITLSDWCVQELGATGNKHLLSPLSNVKFLELTVGILEIDKLVGLLGSFPKLKTLVVKHWGHRLTGHHQYAWEPNDGENHLELAPSLSNSFLLQLRTIEITSIFLELLSPIFSFIEFVLKHASMLEKMVVRTTGFLPSQSEYLLAAADKLLSMPRSSPTAKVVFLRK